jgi:hypothetical protein
VIHPGFITPQFPVAVRLAGDSVFRIAVAGKPDCYAAPIVRKTCLIPFRHIKLTLRDMGLRRLPV